MSDAPKRAKAKFRVGQVAMMKGTACAIKILHPFRKVYRDEFGNDYLESELRPLNRREKGEPSRG